MMSSSKTPEQFKNLVQNFLPFEKEKQFDYNAKMLNVDQELKHSKNKREWINYALKIKILN